MKLHEIPLESRRIDALLEESSGEITPDIEVALAGLDEELSRKVDWVGTLIAEHLSRSSAYENEAARLTAMKRAQLNCADRLQAYLKSTLEALGVERVEGRFFQASIQKTGRPSIRWDGDREAIPEGYRRVSVAPDLNAAQEAYAAGVLPEGFVATFSTSLRIR